jgi:hypothetical protein
MRIKLNPGLIFPMLGVLAGSLMGYFVYLLIWNIVK